MVPFLDTRAISIYLSDHYAGSTTGLELARRAHASNPDGELGACLAFLVEQLDEDRRTLEQIIDAVDARPDRLKVAVAWTGEKLGRLKPNGKLVGYAPLSRVVELEFLFIGITGKLLMWRNLGLLGDPRLSGFDFDELVERAETQLARLEPHRSAASVAALS